ncbi:MAG: T9SS type A sorting domain-containing protein [Flavobacteriales bacterium]|nr:T9SS type A sorting domain-containing protein [Flavobacteriales bacterium]MCX7767533.1 T9SS type A sorting domain-containing protein [Flavobacteriales bacterium]MDW8410394.1 Calx-beta domain-containing protein [Flavobacteriales bacterium]
MIKALLFLNVFSLIMVAEINWALAFSPSPLGGPPLVWINEFHYDNTGTDQGEGIEVAGMAGVDLSCIQIVFYNGANGQTYGTLNLSGVLDDEGCGYGALWFSHAPIQNGAPDGFALVFNPALCGLPGSAQVVQFLSYEGTFTAVNGPAAGMTSTAIPVQETANTPVGYSLQLQGFGTSYSDFYWANPLQASPNDLNPYQFLCGTPPVVFRIANTCFEPPDTLTESVLLLPPCYWVEALNLQSGTHAVQLVLKNTTGSTADIGNYLTQTFVFNPGDGPQPISIPITDDGVQEPYELFEFALRNPTPGDLVGSDSTFYFYIEDNDQGTAPPPPAVWINEIHYDNAGPDQNEGVEIAGVAGENLECLLLVFYDQNGQPYQSTPLSGLLDDEGCGYGAVWFPMTGIQNGPNDGLALVYSPNQCGFQGADTVLYFFSYEGPLTAVSGPADGMTAQQLPVMEGTNTSSGQSLQLAGYGTGYAHFFWTGPVASTEGMLNSQQFICGPPGAIFSIVSCTSPPDTVPENAGAVPACYYVKAGNLNGGPHTVQLVLTSGSAADLNNYTTQVFTFEAGVTPDSLPVTISITDDNSVEGYETFLLALRNNSSGTLISPDSTLAFVVEDNDTPPVLPNVILNPPQVTVSENVGTVTLTIGISMSPLVNVTGQVTVLASSTATQGQDFTLASQTFQFTAGTSQLNLNFPVTIVDDNINESAEYVVLKITNLTNANSSVDTAKVTINDNDPLEVGFVSATGQVSESAGSYLARVAINRPSANPTSVNVSYTGQGTATLGTDFTFTSGTLTWPSLSDDTLTVLIPILNDGVPEPDETFVLALSNATNGATITVNEHTVTIKDQGVGLGEAIQLNERLSVYPNPVRHALRLQLNDPANFLRVTDAAGRTVVTLNVRGLENVELSVSEWASGFYFLEMEWTDKSLTKKRIVKL